MQFVGLRAHPGRVMRPDPCGASRTFATLISSDSIVTGSQSHLLQHQSPTLDPSMLPVDQSA
jgi:hypothetical protein